MLPLLFAAALAGPGGLPSEAVPAANAAASVVVASPGESLTAANAALAANDLAGAEAGYRAVLAAGATTGDIWFDLGNVLYRQDRLAEAVLAWRNAAARLPRDPDVAANLDFARRKLRDGLVAPSPHPWYAPWQVALTPDEAIWIGAALVGLGLLVIAARARQPHVPLAAIGAGAVVVGGLVAAGGFGSAGLPPVAIVLVPEATATSDLGGGVDLFTLHAGAEVQTAEEEAGRTLVVLPDGRKGWLADTSLGCVDPTDPKPVL
jgi:hypothetical protein